MLFYAYKIKIRSRFYGSVVASVFRAAPGALTVLTAFVEHFDLHVEPRVFRAVVDRFSDEGLRRTVDAVRDWSLRHFSRHLHRECSMHRHVKTLPRGDPSAHRRAALRGQGAAADPVGVPRQRAHPAADDRRDLSLALQLRPRRRPGPVRPPLRRQPALLSGRLGRPLAHLSVGRRPVGGGLRHQRHAGQHADLHVRPARLPQRACTG